MSISSQRERRTIQRSQSSFLHHAICDIVTSSTKSTSKSTKKPLLETVYLFEIQLPNKLHNQTLPMSKHAIIDIFDGTNMKRSTNNVLIDLNQLVKQSSSSSRYCTAKIYKLEDKYYVILDWRNFLFFGDIAVVPDFCRYYDTFRWSYIQYLMDHVQDKVHYEKVGSNSCVSDIDISISPKIDFSSEFKFQKYAVQIKKAFEIIMKRHNERFTHTFEDLFDTNIYATNFTIKAEKPQLTHVRQILSDRIFHYYYTKKEHVICFPKIHETILTPNEIEKIHLSQFTFAFRRLFNHLLSHPNPKLTNAMNFYYRLNYNNKELLKGILGDVDLLKYYIYSEVDSNKLVKDYTKYVTKYYKAIDAIVASEKAIGKDFLRTSSLVKDALKYLSIATCMEHDSYHSYGAFLDIVILSGETNKKQYMHSYLFKHSIVDNLGFITDIITRYTDDYCYDDITNILKVSKYIERICNAIINSGDKYDEKRINDIRTIAAHANEARKSGTKEEKSQMAIEVYKIFIAEGDTHINIDDFLEAVLLEFDNYLSL